MANPNPGVQFQGNQLGFKLSTTILKNLTSKMLTAPGNKIVNGDYMGDTAGNYSVYVLRNNLYDPDAQVLGETQTGWYNTDDFDVQNELESIDLKYLYNKKIPVPTLLSMSLPTPTIDSYAEQVSDGLARTIDRTTLGEMVSACLTFAMANNNVNVIQVDSSATYGEDLAKALGEAQVKLDGGFEGKDITCPVEDRFAIMSSEAYQAIIDSGLNLNSNIGAQIEAFNRFYANSIKDFNVFKAVPQILGFSKVNYKTSDGKAGTPYAIGNGVAAICGHNAATTRATDYSVGTRVVLSSEESKTNIIPLYRWAVKCLRPWFIVVICTTAFYNDYKTKVNGAAAASEKEAE